MPEGVILKGVGGFYEVIDKEDFNSIYTCTVRGIHRKRGGLTPLAGDRVTFDILDKETMEGHINLILERKNFFIRPPVSNIDRMALVVSVASPQPDLMLIDKLIITCLTKGIEPLILINKSDLDNGEGLLRINDIYKNTGFPIIALDKFTKEGYEDLHRELVGNITAFAGQSGVGKSTILNLVLQSWVMETGEVCNRIQRGKHTTRHVELFRLNNGGYIMDTPGFSSFSIEDVSHDDLENHYPEFSGALGLCKFKGCSHTGEPQCAVKDLLGNEIIAPERYNRYVEIYQELKYAYDNRYRR